MAAFCVNIIIIWCHGVVCKGAVKKQGEFTPHVLRRKFSFVTGWRVKRKVIGSVRCDRRRWMRGGEPQPWWVILAPPTFSPPPPRFRFECLWLCPESLRCFTLLRILTALGFPLVSSVIAPKHLPDSLPSALCSPFSTWQLCGDILKQPNNVASYSNRAVTCDHFLIKFWTLV